MDAALEQVERPQWDGHCRPYLCLYQAQVERLESLLTGSDQMVAANALLKDLLGEIRVMGDPEAADGVSITL